MSMSAEKKRRFRIERLEERIAPAKVAFFSPGCGCDTKCGKTKSHKGGCGSKSGKGTKGTKCGKTKSHKGGNGCGSKSGKGSKSHKGGNGCGSKSGKGSKGGHGSKGGKGGCNNPCR